MNTAPPKLPADFESQDTEHLRKPEPDAKDLEIDRLNALLTKHGVCDECGEMYSHHYDGPFASCMCKQSEWYDYTPYMKLEKKLIDIREIITVKK